jgi:hypothetical protein
MAWIRGTSGEMRTLPLRAALLLFSRRSDLAAQEFTPHKALELVATSLASILLAFVITIAIGFAAAAQEHHHPPQDADIHDKFYATWMRPDNPKMSCCNKQDCYSPSAVAYRNGSWWATRREDGKWLRIPHEKVEYNRNSPDGRNHLCAPPPSSYYPADTVFCFIAGAGI